VRRFFSLLLSFLGFLCDVYTHTHPPTHLGKVTSRQLLQEGEAREGGISVGI